MTGQLADKVIVIVGGTSGLGLSAARACVAAGARLVIVGPDPQAEQVAETLGKTAFSVVGDATHSDTAPAVAAAVAQFGRLDGLYHVAGGSGRAQGDGPLDEISDEGWEHTLRQNLTSLFYSNRAAAQRLFEQNEGGSVLNLASVLAFAPSPRHFATHAYAAAKSGIVGLTRSCAAYYAARGIRFNALAPGLVDTPMAARAVGDAQIADFVRRKQPLDGGRIGQPTDVDAAVVYFLSDASRFVTGQVLAVDGGWSVSEAE